MNDDLNTEIRQRAYAIWERENRPEGRHLDHWLCAKAELEAERAPVAAKAEQPTDEPSDSPVAAAASTPQKPATRAKRKTR
tara:strand:+ start:218 stop:460 length:243 start_codon:yes stop_codon:yes gene_type:complete